MAEYKVYMWKTVVLEVTVEADDPEKASAAAMTAFDAGTYDDQWGDAETTNVEAICSESDEVAP